VRDEVEDSANAGRWCARLVGALGARPLNSGRRARMRLYLLSALLVVLCGSNPAAELPAGPLPEEPNSQVGYRTVAEAISDLQKRTDVKISTVRGWTIIADSKNLTVWSFAPSTYPAYPAVVKRSALSRAGGGSDVHISVLCEASKPACDDLVREFYSMTRKLPH
jgi:hypothetical protein